MEKARKSQSIASVERTRAISTALCRLFPVSIFFLASQPPPSHPQSTTSRMNLNAHLTQKKNAQQHLTQRQKCESTETMRDDIEMM